MDYSTLRFLLCGLFVCVLLFGCERDPHVLEGIEASSSTDMHRAGQDGQRDSILIAARDHHSDGVQSIEGGGTPGSDDHMVESGPQADDQGLMRQRNSEPANVNAEPPKGQRGVESAVLQPFPNITVRLDSREVEFEGFSCLDVGWLEQIVCTPGTREHEALIVTEALPSHVHAALLMVGFEPGSPGRWEYQDRHVNVVAPTGDAIDVLVMYERSGDTVTEPIGRWIRDHRGVHEFPPTPWIFAGSMTAERPAYLGEGSYYVADQSGSVIGLVTFGDEVLGWPEVMSDQAAVQPPAWEADGDALPPVGTPVTVILRPARPTVDD